jgi:hypothetical protein
MYLDCPAATVTTAPPELSTTLNEFDPVFRIRESSPTDAWFAAGNVIVYPADEAETSMIRAIDCVVAVDGQDSVMFPARAMLR